MVVSFFCIHTTIDDNVHPTMGTFGTLLCCLALVVVGADPTTLGRPDRSTVLEHARGVLRSNGNRGLQSRVPRRASPQSTFSQFLRGTRSGGIRPIEGWFQTSRLGLF